MRVLVAGATGVVGRALLPMLRADGHQVTALVRDATADVEADSVLVADLLHEGAVWSAMQAARPEVVVHQVTALRPVSGDTRCEVFARTAAVRTVGTANLVAGARSAGVRRIVAQSIAFATTPAGGSMLDERAPLYVDAPDDVWSSAVRSVAELERIVLEESGMKGIVLRYGMLYGRDTMYDVNGANWLAISLGRLPLVGAGSGLTSFLHVQDAAEAAALAVRGEATGVFNIVDDDPATARTWLPCYARIVRGPEPKNIPAELGARLLGWFPAYQQTRLRGASNIKAREQLGWHPRVASWRTGLHRCLSGASR